MSALEADPGLSPPIGAETVGVSVPARLAWVSLSILFVFYLLSIVDRYILVLMIPAIKADLHLSDFEISLLQGTAFAAFYTVCSLPIGWAVDRYSRRLVLFFGVFFWSAATFLSGVTRSFAQLFIARMGIGAGEAALNPAAYSILADIFPPGTLARALSIYVFGGTLGTALTFIFGGHLIGWLQARGTVAVPFLGVLKPWQMGFMLVGAPSIILAFLALLLREPKRIRGLPAIGTSAGNASFVTFLRTRLSFIATHNLGFSFLQMAIIGPQVWAPVLLSRHYGWKIGEIGVALGLAQFAGAVIGLPLHGTIVDWLFRRGVKDAHMRWNCLTSALAAPVGVAACVAPSGALMVIGFGCFFGLLIAGPSVGPAALQIVTPRDLRGKASSLYVLFTGLVGVAPASTVIAMITDYIFHDEARLGWSMAAGGAGAAAIAALLLGLGMAPMRRAVDAAAIRSTP